MLFLIFQIGSDRYALDTSSIVEIVPSVALKRMARAPAGIAGLLDYHAAPVPVLDLREMADGQPAETRFSTRLILVKVNELRDALGQPRIIGLLAERATGILQRKPSDFLETGLNIPEAPYLGPVTSDSEGFIQCLRLEGLLTGSVRALLAAPAMALREGAAA